MNTPQILTGQQALDQYGLNALIECRVAVTTELNGLGHSVMQIGVIADPDSCQIDEDDTGVLWVEYQGADDWYLYSIPADEQFVLLDDKNQPVNGDQQKTPAEIYLVPDTEHGLVWSHDPAPGEGMKAEDAVKYVRADLAQSNEMLARRVNELTGERDTLDVKAQAILISRNEYFKKCEQLAAHVEQLKSRLAYFADILESDLLPCLEVDDGCSEDIASARELINKTPAQCLAEVKAQAGMDGFIAGANDAAAYIAQQINAGSSSIDLDAGIAADKYANKIRQSAKAGV